jgi:PQQ-dependent catabolism-associated CXXCW motif protein
MIIDTVRLQAMLRDANPAEGRPRPLLLITINPPPDFTLPGAVWLPSDFASGVLDEAFRQRLKDRLEQLTQGDRTRPLVTIAWNAESWSSRNLALRLAALGYTNVYWYRGGLEAWDVAGLPTEPFGSPTPSVPGK